MSQPSSVLQSVINPKPATPAPTVRPVQPPPEVVLENEAPEPEREDDLDHVLAVLVENAPVAMAMFDAGMRYLLANRQWINDFGLQQSLPLVGRSQFEIFPNLHPGWRSVYDRALQGHIVRSEHDVMPGPNGKPMIFRWEVRPWRRVRNNTVGGVMVTCEKFTAMAAGGVAETEPEAAPSQPSLFESDIPLLVCDGEGLIVQANGAAGKLVLSRGIQPGTSHFWDAFASERTSRTLRYEVLQALSHALGGPAQPPASFTTALPTEERPYGVIRWAVSRLPAGHAEEPRLLLLGIAGDEPPPAPPSPPAPPVAAPAPVPVVPPMNPDFALQLENRRQEEEIVALHQQLRTLQDTDRAYRRRESRQREVLDAMPCGLIVLDERGRPTFHNAQVRALFGCDLKAGETVEDWLMHACLDDSHRQEISTVWRESVWRRQLTKIVSLSTADGLVKDLEFRPTPIGVSGMLLTIHDVTDSCRLEEMLRSTEAKFRALLHESPLAAVLTDITGAIFDANGAAERLLGHPKAELRRMRIDDWLTEASSQLRREELQRLSADGLARASLAVDVHGRDGGVKRVNLELAAIFDGDGKLHSTVHFLQPLPDPVAAVSPAPAPVMVEEPKPRAAAPVTKRVHLLSTDPQGRIASWSPQAEAMFQWPGREAVGKPSHLLFRPSDSTGFLADLKTALARGPGDVRWAWFGRNGAKGFDTFRLVPLDAEGGLAMTVIFGSESEGAAASAKDQEKVVQTYVIGPTSGAPWPEADLDREQLLLTETHHRIKNHLQIISSLLNLQGNNLDDPAARQALRASQNRVRTIAALHQHLYQLSAGEETGIQEFAEELVVRLRDCYDIPATQVEVNLILEDCDLREEWHMPLALILNEAVSNAFKHAFPGGRRGNLHISLLAGSKEGRLIVKDDGVGLPENFNSMSCKGLGLKVIGVFADQMKGRVSMKNITDQGLTFDLRFPIGCVDI